MLEEDCDCPWKKHLEAENPASITPVLLLAAILIGYLLIVKFK